MFDLRVKCRLASRVEAGWRFGDGSVTAEAPSGTMWLAEKSDCTLSVQPCRHLLIALPNGDFWDVDRHESGARNIWIRSGDPPDVSVHGACDGGPGSIGINRNGAWVYHAFLWKGELIEIERSRDSVEFARLTMDQQTMLSERLPLSFPPPTGALGKIVTVVLREPDEMIAGRLIGVGDGMIRLDSGEYPIGRYARVFVDVDWWKLDVEMSKVGAVRK